jgi:hypothetical protein
MSSYKGGKEGGYSLPVFSLLPQIQGINHLRLADRNHFGMMGRFSRVMSI